MDVGFFWSPETGLIELVSTEFKFVSPVDLNDGDQLTCNGVNLAVGPVGSLPYRTILWTPTSKMRDLGALTPNGDSFANSINEKGWVVGNSLATGGGRHPVLWKPGEPITDLGLPSGFTLGYAPVVNDAGDVGVELGQELTGGSTKSDRPFLWREESGYERLSCPEGYDEIWVLAMNNKGAILLGALTDQRPENTYFVLRNGRLTQLPDAPLEGRTSYSSLNDRGWLTGFITLPGDDLVRKGFTAKAVR